MVSRRELLAGFAHGWHFGHQCVTVLLLRESKDTAVQLGVRELWLGRGGLWRKSQREQPTRKGFWSSPGKADVGSSFCNEV